MCVGEFKNCWFKDWGIGVLMCLCVVGYYLLRTGWIIDMLS